ncbi:MAG: MarR family transcriptional regulator [Methanoregula sp.]|nr:MAG: MarR family transcriptional regulator [Methanoregula sp.]
MKDEHIDWLIYHLIEPMGPVTVEELAKKSGLDPATVEKSILRLENDLLVEQYKGRIRLLSFGESLIRCQVRYDPALPYTIENGVIKEKKRPDP